MSLTPWLDVEAAIWDFLRSDADYVGLELKEFAGHEGRFFPIDPESGEIPESMVPAIHLRLLSVKQEQATHGTWEDTLTLFGGIVCRVPPEPASPSRADFETKVTTVRRLLTGIVARRTGFQSDSIGHYVLQNELVREIRAKRDTRPRYWAWLFQLVPTGSRS